MAAFFCFFMKRIIAGVILSFLIFSLFSFESVDSVLNNMTLEEKVGQLFVIRPESIDLEILHQEKELKKDIGITKLNRNSIDFYNKYPAGGFILFNRNIVDPEQLTEFTKELHILGNVKPLIFIDEEGGSVARIARTKTFEVEKFTNMRSLGSTGSLETVFNAGITIGNYLKKYGIDVDFAPVADVDTNPDNPVIGNRAFSSDPYIAAEMALAFLQGLEKTGVEGCFKHFPGHGDTNTDTHLGYTEIRKNLKELYGCELIPFQYGISNDIPMIMIAHISLPQVTYNKMPASLSYEIITELLKRDLGYKGLIITDSLSMKAVTNIYSPEEAAVETILAGSDFILLPENYEKAFYAVYNAVISGIIPEERINESVLKILNFKKKFIKNDAFPLD